jgi:hypothetical protein
LVDLSITNRNVSKVVVEEIYLATLRYEDATQLLRTGEGLLLSKVQGGHLN